MKIIGRDCSNMPIRETKTGKYLWQSENKIYELREPSFIPNVLDKLICYFHKFPKNLR